MSLATDWRPRSFGEVVGQEAVVRVLERQVESGSFAHAYLFCGPSGDGKTTMARIFASAVNKGQGAPIEIDAASNNGVDQVRALVEEASERSLDGEYKLLVLDEAHMITTAGWNAFLKGIEEAPKYTIYIFCTTDPQKIPATIANRCMRFNFSKIPTAKIEERLRLISSKEGYSNYGEACGYIARMADGGMRDAISMLEKCADYDRDLSMDNVLKCLGNMSYDTLFDLVNSMVDGDRAKALSIVDGLCDAGVDMRSFAEQFLGFCLDLCKYSLTHDASSTSVPASLEKVQGSTRCLAYAAGIENAPAYFSRLSGKALALKAALRNDFGPRTTAEAYVLSMCGGD